MDKLNGFCTDTRCEGAYEWYFADLSCRTPDGPCDITARVYLGRDTPNLANVVGVRRTTSDYTAMVLGHGRYAACTPPCYSEKDKIAPCLTIDVGCTFTANERGAQETSEPFNDAANRCLDAIEAAITEALRAPARLDGGVRSTTDRDAARK